jgi:hypothetical protein
VKGPDLHEQTVNQVLFNREKPASETFEMLTKALVMMPRVKGKLLIGFSHFKDRQASGVKFERSGRPSSGRADENAKKVRQIFNEDYY